MKEFLKQKNSYGVPYSLLTTGTRVVVDIPVDHHDTCVEVEGVISSEIFRGGPGMFYSQIRLVKQLTRTESISLGNGLYAVYPEKVKRIL